MGKKDAPRPTYTLRWPTEDDVSGIYQVFLEGANGLGGPVPSKSIVRFITALRYLTVVLEAPDKMIVGAFVNRFPTLGVCFSMLLAVKKSCRGMGFGGGLITGVLHLLKESTLPIRTRASERVANPYKAHKWFAVYPAYNKDVDVLYKMMKFPAEGILKAHTRAKTDLHIRAFYLEEMPLPRFYHEFSDAPIIDPKPIFCLPPKMQTSLHLTDDISGEKDGELW